jgi:TLD
MRSRNRSNGNYQWLNTKSYGMPHGLALGGSLESFRLFITDTFENCVASESCLTFEGGSLLPEAGPPPANTSDSNPTFAPLLSKNNFEIDHIEVYACGGEKFIQSGMKALEKDREVRDENIQKARQVDKAQFFNNVFDQEFLLSATFAHKTQTAENSEIP